MVDLQQQDQGQWKQKVNQGAKRIEKARALLKNDVV
jgi:hypothetical protein